MSVLGLELSTDNIYSLVLSCHDCSFSLYYHMCSAALRYHPHSVASFRCTPPQRSSPLPQVHRAPLRCLNCGATLCCHKKPFLHVTCFQLPLSAQPQLSAASTAPRSSAPPLLCSANSRCQCASAQHPSCHLHSADPSATSVAQHWVATTPA